MNDIYSNVSINEKMNICINQPLKNEKICCRSTFKLQMVAIVDPSLIHYENLQTFSDGPTSSRNKQIEGNFK